MLNTMMMKQHPSQETLPPHPLPTYQPAQTLTPPDTSTPSVISPDTTATLSYPSVYTQAGIQDPGSRSQAYIRNDTLELQLRSKLSQLVSQISKDDTTWSEDEATRRVEKSSRVRQRERVCETQKEREIRRDMERNKWEMEKLSERWIERQISREKEGSDVVRQRHRDEDRKDGTFTRLDGSSWEESDRRRVADRQQVRTDWESRDEVEIPRQAQSNGPRTGTTWDTWTSTSEKASPAEKSEEEEEEDISIKNVLTQTRRKEERNLENASEQGREAHSTSFDPEEQVSPTEVNRTQSVQ